MKTKLLDREALRAITPTALSAYARAEGWKIVDRFGAHSDVYAESNRPELVIPRTDRLGDYAEIVSRLIGIFGQVEGRDEHSLYSDLVGADRDVIRIRAPGADEDGSVALQRGVRLVSDARDMLLAAACSARSPQPVYRAGGNRDAIEYLERVRLGQTERGSYVVTLLAPVPPTLDAGQTELWPDLTEEPFDRLVTRRFVSALTAARSAVEESRIGKGTSAFEAAIQSGVSANLCESLASLIETGEGLDVSVTWARTRPTPESRRVVVFSQSDSELLVEAARGYRLRAPKQDIELVGYVHILKREQTRIDGLVKIRTEIDGAVQSVKAQLDQTSYAIAIKAHDDQVAIVVHGDLERSGQRWQLTNVSSIRMIPKAEADDMTDGEDD